MLLCTKMHILAQEIYEHYYGSTLTASDSTYDFWSCARQKRVEIKTSIMTKSSNSNQYWCFNFQHIKVNNFDELFLVFLFPDRIEFWMCDEVVMKNLPLASVGNLHESGKAFRVYIVNGKFDKKTGELIHRIYFWKSEIFLLNHVKFASCYLGDDFMASNLYKKKSQLKKDFLP